VCLDSLKFSLAKSIDHSLPKYQRNRRQADSAARLHVTEAHPLPGTVHVVNGMEDEFFKLGGKIIEPIVFLLELKHQGINVHK
jgi:hypothetical protein